MVQVEPVTAGRMGDVEELFTGSAVTIGCWCMWFILPVRDYHAGGPSSNRAKFATLVAEESIPVGLLAYQRSRPVGWCAVGPRRRYDRALRTPALRGRDRQEDASVWLVPCFYVKPGTRRAGVARALLQRAVEFARDHGASAVEGFPYAGTTRRSGGDSQVGVERLFAACGFTVVRRPTPHRVVMRLDFG